MSRTQAAQETQGRKVTLKPSSEKAHPHNNTHAYSIVGEDGRSPARVIDSAESAFELLSQGVGRPHASMILQLTVNKCLKQSNSNSSINSSADTVVHAGRLYLVDLDVQHQSQMGK